ncbi:MAG: biotin synthase BioB [Deltaproteobacteria bacterium]|nr:biotin synthase BioB [Deltaproteobacteria bacterium]MCL5792644.1 biotin synthase BioB [Deltaproteobacteria bacterium]
MKLSAEYVIENNGITFDEAKELSLIDNERLLDLFNTSNKMRLHYKGNEVNTCSILNAKSGLCPEDCNFCAQSVHHKTSAKVYPLLSAGTIIDKAKQADNIPAKGFSIVTSGYGIDNSDELEIIAQAVKGISEQTHFYGCASLGILTEHELNHLKESGLVKYHHNLETSRSFFPNVCTTHPYEDDIEAIGNAKRTGLKVCSGGIFGLGESWEDRIELAFTLKRLDVDSVPINFLNPVKGTPLEDVRNLTPLECLKVIAIYRLILPDKDIVICGGREVNLRDLQSMIFFAGANGMMLGGYLTTSGRPVETDLQMLKDLGLAPAKPLAV